MKKGFTPISAEGFIKGHLKSNKDTTRAEIESGLCSALQAFKAGKKCRCGNPLWVIGSAVAGHACFTCITGESSPHNDYEIDEACNKKS